MTTKQAPLAAFHFLLGPADLRPTALAAKGKEKNRVAVRMRARSGQPVNHWFWGNVVHDMAGFSAASSTIPVDYCHNDGEVLGYLSEFKPSSAGLDVAGELVRYRDGDRTDEILTKAAAGVPYQSSIYFDGGSALLEDVPTGATASVNGYTLSGPGLIFRKWMLRGVAICPYGYDHRTATKFSAGTAAVRVMTAQEVKSAAEFRHLTMALGSEGLARCAQALKLPGRKN